MTDAQTWNELADEITALRAENTRLRALQEKEPCDYCEYCTGQKSICTVKCGKRTIAWLYTDDDVLVAEYQDGSIPEMRKKINYCPMCGAKMEVE